MLKMQTKTSVCWTQFKIDDVVLTLICIADHPDYDPRTLYIPPKAWAGFSAFEKQYWEIKCKLYDTVVFFKKVWSFS